MGTQHDKITTYTANDLLLCQSADGWSLHAPGSTDEEIADGDAPYILSGEGEPTSADYDRAWKLLCQQREAEMSTQHDKIIAKLTGDVDYVAHPLSSGKPLAVGDIIDSGRIGIYSIGGSRDDRPVRITATETHKMGWMTTLHVTAELVGDAEPTEDRLGWDADSLLRLQIDG